MPGRTAGLISFFGNTLALDAHQESNGNGRVYLFHRAGESAPFAHAETVESKRTDAEQMGQALALSEGRLVAMAPAASGAANWNGIVYTRKLPADRPVVVEHPESVSVAAGDPLILRARAAGAPPLVYRWYRNAQFVQETVEPVFERTEAGPADAGTYFVEAVRHRFGKRTLAGNLARSSQLVSR